MYSDAINREKETIIHMSLASTIAQLKDTDPNVRSSAVLALGKSGNQEALPYLIDVLCNDPELSLQEDATWSLVRFGVDAVPALQALLSNKQARIRHNAVHTLGKIGAPEAVPALLQTLKDDVSIVRLKSVYALGQIGAVSAIVSLIPLLADRQTEVQTMTIDVLIQFGENAVDDLCASLQHKNMLIREHVVGILSQIGDVRAVDALIGVTYDDEADVRLAVAQALGELGDARGVASLKHLCCDDDLRVRAMARAMLQQFA